jgi:uncharacterized protein YbcI
LSNTKGQIEAQISEAIIRFEKEYMGRGPVETKTFIIEDIILVRLKGVITRAEHHLATTGEAGRGRELIKQTRMELIEKARPLLESVIESIVGQPVVSLHTDISTRTGERIIIFTLEKEPAFEDIGKSNG